MKLTTAIQEALLALLCYDGTIGGGKFVAALVPPATFDPYYREIAADTVAFIEKYGVVPGEHTLDIFESIKARQPDAAEIFERLYASLEQVKDGINREYVLTQAKAFSRFQRLRRGVTEAIDQLRSNDEVGVNAAEAALRDAMKDSVELFDAGIIMSNAKQSLSFLDETTPAFPTGIRELDMYEQGPARGQLCLLIAPYGKGKSWWLQHLAKIGILHGLRVAYITLEMSERLVAQRMIQSLFAVGKRDETITRYALQQDELGRLISFDRVEIKNRPYLRDPGIRPKLEKKLELLRRRPPMVVKGFPTGSLSVRQLEGYFDGLESSMGFIPDLVLIDYADLMDVDMKNMRVSLGNVYKGIRGLAQKRNCAVASCSQSNKDGWDAKTIKGKHVAEDASKMGTIDVGITYNQTEAEHKLGLARLYVDKGRGDVDRYSVLISQAYGIGQFCLESCKMNSDYFEQIDASVQEQNHA